MSDKDEVLKVYPDAYVSFWGQIYRPIYRNNSQYGEFLGESWADARSRLPNAPDAKKTDRERCGAVFTDDARMTCSRPKDHSEAHFYQTDEARKVTGGSGCVHDEREVLGTCDHMDAPHSLRECQAQWHRNWKPNAPAPQLTHEQIEAAFDAQYDETNVPDSPAPEPVEQGERTITLSDVAAAYKATPAPSQPELPPLKFRPTSEYHAMGLSFTVEGFEGSVRIEREAQLLECIREIQQLREQLEASRHAGEVLMHTSNANFDRFKAAEQQLAQIRSAKAERPELHLHVCKPRKTEFNYYLADKVDPILDKYEQSQAAYEWLLQDKNNVIAALRQDNAQKDARIQELEGGK